MHKDYLNGRQYHNLVNPRSLLTLAIAMISCYTVVHFNIRIHQDLILFGLILSFPVVFSIQSAFKRRDRALEYMSIFKAGMTSVYRSITRVKKLTDEEKQELKILLTKSSDSLMCGLRNPDLPLQLTYDTFNDIYLYNEKHRGQISTSVSNRVIRYMREVQESATYLLSLREHRTIFLLRFFSFIFINLFPFLQASLLYAKIGDELPTWIIFLASGITSITLITMYNIQLQLEYPFDQIGKDDIHISDFEFEQAEFFRHPAKGDLEEGEPLQVSTEDPAITSTGPASNIAYSQTE